MERIRDISKVRKGDFVSFKGTLSVIVAVQIKDDVCFLTLDSGEVIEKDLNERMEFFRTIEKIHLD